MLAKENRLLTQEAPRVSHASSIEMSKPTTEGELGSFKPDSNNVS